MKVLLLTMKKNNSSTELLFLYLHKTDKCSRILMLNI